MAKSDIFGWDLLYKVTEKQIRGSHDVIICLTHWKLIHQGFRCVGVGEDTTLPSPEEQSELLPDGWNAANKYSLRYVHNGKLYLLNAIKNENNMIINLNRVVDNIATGTCIDLSVVKETQGPLIKLIPNYDEVINKIARELIDKMLKTVPSKDVHTQTPIEHRETVVDTRRSEPFFAPPERDFVRPQRPLYSDPLAVGIGRSDLDPLAPLGGGMLFEPPGMNPRLPGGPGFDPTLPRGAIPPGARFDPYRPPGAPPRPRQPMNPDHDHMPPPGYDDMFM